MFPIVTAELANCPLGIADVPNSPELELYDNHDPEATLKCALASEAEGPVYVITPEVLLYAKDPSPPLSVTDTDPLALDVVKY